MNAAVLHTLGRPPRRSPDGQRRALRQSARTSRGVRCGWGRGSRRRHAGVLWRTPPAVWRDGGAEVVARARCWPVPEGLEDVTAAAFPNPALSSWLPLTWRAQLAAGETVLILGATGTAGKLAIRIAKLLGAGRVVAAGRNEQVLRTLPSLGADALIHLEGSDHEVTQAFAREAGDKGYDGLVDYLWGHPTVLLLPFLTGEEFSQQAAGQGLIAIVEGPRPLIYLPATPLRSAGFGIP